MSAREAKLLDELRSKELKALTDAEFKAVKGEVESKGIRNLKGSAAQIVFAALRKRDEAMKKATVAKHGNHDQSTHGAWAGNGSGGNSASGAKNIQDMTASDQKEFITRMSSAKSGEEQRKIIDEFKMRYSSKKKINEVSSDKYNIDDSEGEDSSEPKNFVGKKPKVSYDSNDTEGEFYSNADDPRWMDDMDILRPPARSPKK